MATLDERVTSLEARVTALEASMPKPTPAPTPTPTPVVIGTGNDTLVLKVAADSYQGDPQFTVAVDGIRIGGTLTTKASRALGQSENITIKGNWGTTQHRVTIDYINNLYVSDTQDRNLYLLSATYNGVAVPNSTLSLMSAGAQMFLFGTVSSQPTSVIDLRTWVQLANGRGVSYNSNGTAMTVTLHQGDSAPWDATCDFAGISRGWAAQLVPSTKAWTFEFDFSVDPGDPIVAGWIICMEIHADEGIRGGSPPFSIQLGGESIHAVFIGGPFAMGNDEWHWSDGVPLVRGHTYHIKCELLFMPAGYARLWIDGQQILNFTGALGYDTVPNYPMLDLYRSASTETTVAHYSNVRITTV